MTEEPSSVTSPLDAVFEQAVRPYATTDALRADYPADTPVILMRKSADLPMETRDLEGGGTLRIPVLAAIKDSKVAQKSRVGAFDFAAMDRDAVALVLPRTAGRPADIRVVTKGEGGALLCADLDGMLGAVVAIADNEALRAFPGGEFLIDALRTGLTQAKDELHAALTKPDETGKSLLEQLEEAATPLRAPRARAAPQAKPKSQPRAQPRPKPKAKPKGKAKRR